MGIEGPYTYPLNHRPDIEAWLGEHTAYTPRKGAFQLAWDIKCNYRWDTSAAAYRDDFNLEDRFDAAWQGVLKESDLFDTACEDATRPYTDGEWTPSTGEGYGGYTFSISGRSGGWMLLDTCPIADVTLVWADHSDFRHWLEDLDDEDLNNFYRAIVQLDHNLSREGCRAEMEYQYAFQRSVWEADIRAAEEYAARTIEASRPDMYMEDKGNEL